MWWKVAYFNKHTVINSAVSRNFMVTFYLLNHCSQGNHYSTPSRQLGCCSILFKQVNGVLLNKVSLFCILVYLKHILDLQYHSSTRNQLKAHHRGSKQTPKDLQCSGITAVTCKAGCLQRRRKEVEQEVERCFKLIYIKWSTACLICEYAEHPTPDSSPLIKAWLEAQVAIAHLYENT